MWLFKVLKLFKSLLLLSMIGPIFVTASGNGNVARNLSLASTTVRDGDDITSLENHPQPPEPPPPLPPEERPNTAPFKPSIVVIVGALTTMFSITFLLLLYAKHCKRGDDGYSNNSRGRVPPSSERKNSGVDRTVIESLPVFRFGSLRGAKDGLECAVCLNRFESTEVLRLLPKCKHAFHVECVDTWLDAHSTCPLCRYRVDPEDVLLIGDDAKIVGQNEPSPPPPLYEEIRTTESLRRVSGRHSSAGERGTSGRFWQIVLHRQGDSTQSHHNNGDSNHPLTTRRSLDSWNMTKKKKTTEVLSVGCFERQHRKDGLLLLTSKEEERTSSEQRRLEHRIIIGDSGRGFSARSGFHQRWSDVQPSDLLYLRSEMIMSDSRRLSASSSGSRPLVSRHQNHPLPVHNNDGQSGRSVINVRSVSEITGLSRFGNGKTGNNHRQHHHHYSEHGHHQQRQWWQRLEREQEAGLVSRWLAWISQSRSQLQSQQIETHPAVRPALPA